MKRGIDLEKMEEIKKALKKIKGDWFEESENLITDGYISSFELLKLICELENSFGIDIPIVNIEPEIFNSIEGIYELIKKIQSS